MSPSWVPPLSWVDAPLGDSGEVVAWEIGEFVPPEERPWEFRRVQLGYVGG
ncbi:hypothetical protein ACFWIA_12875 [Streptomyces sp. NPDC127068]|uniref:hypothetical protein n=1 Tax=Streptomyces sp. NPDC127068 TaxID=3347127 RepID=UPI0036475C97